MSAFPPSKARLLEITKLQCKIFNQNFNPTHMRTGAKILNKKLKGDAIKNYYGNPDFIRFKDLRTLYPTLTFVDPEEAYRVKVLEAYVLKIFSYIELFTNILSDVNVEVKVLQQRRRKQVIKTRRRNRKGLHTGICK